MGEEFPVEIIIKERADSKPLFISEELANIQGLVPIHVIVDKGPGFDLIEKDGRYYTTIYVPIEEKDSDSVIFLLKAKNVGIQNIYIRFYSQKWAILDSRLIVMEVRSHQSMTTPIDKQVSDSYNSPTLEFEIRPEPSITMLIEDRRDSSPMGISQYQILLMLAIPQVIEQFIRISDPIKFDQSRGS